VKEAEEKEEVSKKRSKDESDEETEGASGTDFIPPAASYEDRKNIIKQYFPFRHARRFLRNLGFGFFVEI